MAIASASPGLGQSIDLAGNWKFQLDPSAIGIQQQWYARTLSGELKLPGSCQEQGYGEVPSADSSWTVDRGYTRKIDSVPQFKPYLEEGGKYRSPIWWTPDRLYVGAAWYQKEVSVPDSMRGKSIRLELERVHWESKLWIDDQYVGVQNGMGTPHIYDLSAILTPGPHRITLRVDNRIKDIDIGAGGHAISDHTQSNWNGIIGKIALVSDPAVSIERIRVDARDYQNKIASLSLIVRNVTNKNVKATIDLTARTMPTSLASADQQQSYQADPLSLTTTVPAGERHIVNVDYPLGNDAPVWTEFDPKVFELSARLTPDSEGLPVASASDHKAIFGIRDITSDGTAIYANGRKVFLRGTLDCCIWPQTGYPPMDRESWEKVFRVVRQHGLNHVRYHSWTPPKAAFQVADRWGIYLQPEMLMWVEYGAGEPVDEWILSESRRMFDHYGNHPCFALMAIGNECRCKNAAFADEIIGKMQTEDPRRIYTDNASRSFSGLCDFEIAGVKFSQRRKHPWGVRSNNTDYDANKYFASRERPTVTHEDGQWASYPNMHEETKFQGSLHPYYLEIYRELMKQAGIWDRYQEYFLASGRLQASLYKATVEAGLRAPDCAGLQLLDLRDFPGQGYAPVGLLDSFWDSKGYCDTEQFRSFCGDVVPLARFDSHVRRNDQPFKATVQVSNYGETDLKDATITWTLSLPNQKVGQGIIRGDLPTGTVTTIGQIEQDLGDCKKATRATLKLSIDGQPLANQWPLWIYPAAIGVSEPTSKATSGSVCVTHKLDDDARKRLDQGGAVLLTPPPSWVNGKTTGAFSPIFWTRVMFLDQPVHTLGGYVQNTHPALSDFPSDTFTDWQWYDLMENSKPMIMNSLPKTLRGIVEPIDDWNNPRRLGLIFEAKVGKGKLLVCSINIEDDLENRPAAGQLRHSLVRYAASPQFDPAVSVELEAIANLFSSAKDELIQRSSASSSAANYPIRLAMDDNPDTFWHSPWEGDRATLPQSLTIDLGEPQKVGSVHYTPRQTGNDRSRVKDYEILVSDGGGTWQTVHVGSFVDGAATKTIALDQPVQRRFVRFKMLSAQSGHTVSVAEIAVR